MKKLLYTFLAVSIIFSACEKEEDADTAPTISGCMNSNANNYNPNANVDDGSCNNTNTPLTAGEQVYVPDDNFEARLEANGMGNGIANDDSVALSNINTVTHLGGGGGISLYQDNISDLTGIEYFSSLGYLSCQSLQLTSLDVSNNTALWYLRLSNAQLTSLDVSNNTALTTLYCFDNQLTSLDVSGATALTTLYCDGNQLTSLDVSNNTALTTLYCFDNQLTSLDVSGNLALNTVYCANNQLTSLDCRNKNTDYFRTLSAQDNPSLFCISADSWLCDQFATGDVSEFDSNHWISNTYYYNTNNQQWKVGYVTTDVWTSFEQSCL